MRTSIIFVFLSTFLGTGCLPNQGGKVEYRKKSSQAHAGNSNADPCNRQTQTSDHHAQGLAVQGEYSLNEDHDEGHGDQHPPSSNPTPSNGATGTGSGAGTTSQDCQKQGGTTNSTSDGKVREPSHPHSN